MKRSEKVSLACIVLLSLLALTAGTVAAQQKTPNVVLILADNVGYGDLGPYGGGELRGAPTPRIDQLAREGLRLTQYLVEPGCTPSRAALMTGQYSIRNGLSLIIVPGSPSTLSKDAVMMGELFKGAGYATAIFGKWHLGIGSPTPLPRRPGNSWPRDRTSSRPWRADPCARSSRTLARSGPRSTTSWWQSPSTS
jgi:arylsulfatase A-like enzyme